jgi:hypothetical protein
MTERHDPATGRTLRLGDQVAADGIRGTLIAMERSPFGRMTFHTFETATDQTTNDGTFVPAGSTRRTTQVAVL